ncbi:hypothetical protein CFP56_041928 [Quercus suber]|uniref:Uncharacterized protein n=1 Tax=Quercus suber TaxID=58331 RepID=A0AAW0LIH4_QUESU
MSGQRIGTQSFGIILMNLDLRGFWVMGSNWITR